MRRMSANNHRGQEGANFHKQAGYMRAMISSHINDQLSCKPEWVHIWQEAGLLKPSAIKPVITTIEKTLVINTMGRLSEDDQKALQESLKAILGRNNY